MVIAPSPRVAVVGAESAAGRMVAASYAKRGSLVREVRAEGQTPAAIATALGDAPIDVLVFADAFLPPDRDPAAITRSELREGLERLTYLTFRVANLMRPLLANDSGKLVLITRTTAAMDRADPAGRYLERPFRAAAHALWRCFSIEWRDSGIACLVVALDDPDDATEIARLPAVIASTADGKDGVRMVDSRGAVRSW